MIIHLDNPEESDVPLKRFQFPDGQPHCEFDPVALREAAQKGTIDVIGVIKSGDDLLNVALSIERDEITFSAHAQYLVLAWCAHGSSYCGGSTCESRGGGDVA
jgi:hypothetical protein